MNFLDHLYMSVSYLIYGYRTQCLHFTCGNLNLGQLSKLPKALGVRRKYTHWSQQLYWREMANLLEIRSLVIPIRFRIFFRMIFFSYCLYNYNIKSSYLKHHSHKCEYEKQRVDPASWTPDIIEYHTFSSSIQVPFALSRVVLARLLTWLWTWKELPLKIALRIIIEQAYGLHEENGVSFPIGTNTTLENRIRRRLE